jgi:putative ABC transport system permease protein
MNIFDAILTAFQSLYLNLMRSLLTMLGIIIGVAAVITMVTIGNGAKWSVEQRIQSLGSNLIIVVPGSRHRGGVSTGSGTRLSLTEDDATAIANEIDIVKVAAPLIRGSAQLIAGNLNWQSRVEGTTPEAFPARNWVINEGRIFNDAEVKQGRKVAVIGQTIAENMWPGVEPVGQKLRINRVPFIVIGVLKKKGQSSYGTDQDDIIMMPISSARSRVIGKSRFGKDKVEQIMIQATSSETVPQLEAAVTELLRARHELREGQPNGFRIRNLASFMQASSDTADTFSMLLAAVAGVSLVVGGIGITNIMLVSVTERTREIGLRMAIGARPSHIMTQFALEAIVLSVVGGAIGVALGYGISALFAAKASWPLLVDSNMVLIALLFSVGVGLFFGFYPAKRAAQLDPIEALRRE